MGFYDNSLNLGNLFQGVQANNLLVNKSSLNASSDLTVKQPITSISNFNNIQASGLASALGGALMGGIFGSSQSATNPFTQFTSMMPQMSAMGSSGLFSIPSLGAANNSTSPTNPFKEQMQKMQSEFASVLDNMPLTNSAGTLIKRYKIEGATERISFIDEKGTDGKPKYDNALTSGWFKEDADVGDFIENLNKNITEKDNKTKTAVNSTNTAATETDRINNITAKSLAEEIFNVSPDAKNCTPEKKTQIINGLEKIAKGEQLDTEGKLDKDAEAALLIFKKDPATSTDSAKIKLLQSMASDLSTELKKGIDKKESMKNKMAMGSGISTIAGTGKFGINPATGVPTFAFPEIPKLTFPDSTTNNAEETENTDESEELNSVSEGFNAKESAEEAENTDENEEI